MSKLEAIKINNNMSDILYSYEQGIIIGKELAKIELLTELLNFDIDSELLSKTFQVSKKTIEKLKEA